MGRLPDTYRNRKIESRTPYVMQSRVDAINSQQLVTFPSGSFLYEGINKVFEVHRMIPRVFEVDANGDIVSDLGEWGLAFVNARIRDTARDQEMTKQATPLAILTLGSEERTWEWPEPYHLDKSEGFVVTFDVINLGRVFDTPDIPLLRVALAFEGFLLDFKEA